MAKLQEVLSDSNSQENLKKLIRSLGSETGGDLPAGLSSLLDPPKKEESPPLLGGITPDMLLKMQKLLQGSRQDDRNAALIRALRPHLKEERRHRADEALRLLQLFSLLPLLRESGILGELFGGEL